MAKSDVTRTPRSKSTSSKTSRRKVLKSLAGAGGVVAGVKAMPTSWQQPMVSTTMLPAHATSTCVNASEGSSIYTVPTGGSPDTFIVPEGVCELFVIAYGAQGGGGGGGGNDGSPGAGVSGSPGTIPLSVNTSFNVTGGQALSIQVGGPGVGGDAGLTTEGNSGGAGGTGAPGGEQGGPGTSAPEGQGASGGGGGGGGTSRVFDPGMEYVYAAGGPGGPGGQGANEGPTGGGGGAGSTGEEAGLGIPSGPAFDGAGGFGAGQPGSPNSNDGEDGTPGAAGTVQIDW